MQTYTVALWEKVWLDYSVYTLDSTISNTLEMYVQ